VLSLARKPKKCRARAFSNADTPECEPLSPHSVHLAEAWQTAGWERR
jgi:hypothetical protein